MAEEDVPTFVILTAVQRHWRTFIARTGLRELLFFLDCSVPGARDRLRRLHRPGLRTTPDGGPR